MKINTSQAVVASRLLFCLLLALLLSSGCVGFAQNNTVFGPNVYVFTPSDSVSSINSTLNTLNAETQFSTNRWAVLFAPGTYTGVEAEVGFYESVAGLGMSPSAVHISNGYLEANQVDSNGNVTTNFWRSLENMQITAPSGTTLQWAVSQGAAYRRVYVDGSKGLELTNTSCGEASGGFMDNNQITGKLNACSQQQWFTRNSTIGSWSGNVWNFVFSGVTGAPAQSSPFGTGANANTVLATTPVSREKPYLYVDSNSNYNVFVPTVLTNWSGTDWTANSGLGTGYSLAISTFLIATPSTSLATINSALAAGQNLILTPGIYQYSGAINVVNAKTIILGLGYATLVPQTGTAAITVADVDGVQIAGLLIDAGPVNSPVLLQIGVEGASRVSHASNPTSINDVFFAIGGATAGTATTAMEIDSDNVILDNIWAWRADHGADAAWTGNVALHGLVVNGDNVTALGLAVEHFEEEQVQWFGNYGETIFYQSEMPYDVPSQTAWMDNGIDGYASYNVEPNVTNHTAYGLGVYSYFDQGVDIIANSGIAAPVAAGVKFTDMVTVWLNGSGQITNTIASNNGTVDNAGTTVLSGATLSDVSTWGGSAGNCTAVPSVPGTPSGTGTSTTAISVTWGASTAGSSCTVSYNLFRSTTSGFTPSSSNQIASGLNSASYADSGLTASTTYYYVVESADGDGSSAASTQGSGATLAPACSAVTVAPTGLLAAATSTTAIGLNWTAPTPPANCTVSSYTIYGGTTSNPTTVIASGVTGTSYTNSGLTPSTTYYYTVAAVDAYGTSPVSTQASTATLTPSCSAAPNAPTGLTATATSSSAITVSWSAVTPPANCSISSYTVYGGTTANPTTVISSGSTATSFNNTGLSASTTYYYVVKAIDAYGTSVASTQTSTATQASGSGTDFIAIACGGPAESNSGGGDASFVADVDFSGGADNSHTTKTINLTQPGANAAPMAVYQYGRAGTATYTIPGMVAGSQHTVLLHFAENYYSAAGKRAFNVAINGTPVLTNLDIYATVGEYAALVDSFTATANSSGDIVIALSNGTANQPLIMGIEIR